MALVRIGVAGIPVDVQAWFLVVVALLQQCEAGPGQGVSQLLAVRRAPLRAERPVRS